MIVRRIDDRISVSPQIDPADVTALAAQSFTAIVNNRPDGEEAGQPEGSAVEAAARSAGLAYTAIPVAGGFSQAQIDAMRAALDAADGPVLAFCRSGTRSTNLWALAEAKAGGHAEVIVAKAAAAGYDLAGLRPTLEALAKT
jgi:uncharacterized protein (TIGR01244 family)